MYQIYDVKVNDGLSTKMVKTADAQNACVESAISGYTVGYLDGVKDMKKRCTACIAGAAMFTAGVVLVCEILSAMKKKKTEEEEEKKIEE